MPLYREGGSIARLVVVEQEQEIVDAEDGLLLNRNIELEVPCQGTVDVLNQTLVSLRRDDD
jgi:hypothetical protein